MTIPRRVIPNAVPHLAGNEWKYVKECLDTNWVSSAGPFVDRFEREMAQSVGVPHAVATVNGTGSNVSVFLRGPSGFAAEAGSPFATGP